MVSFLASGNMHAVFRRLMVYEYVILNYNIQFLVVGMIICNFTQM